MEEETIGVNEIWNWWTRETQKNLLNTPKQMEKKQLLGRGGRKKKPDYRLNLPITNAVSGWLEQEMTALSES